MVKLKWHGDKFYKSIEKKAVTGMTKANIFINAEMVNKINRGQPVHRTSGGSVYGLDPSKPGEAPKVVTGRLKQSLSHGVQVSSWKVVGRHVADTEYAIYLELDYVGKNGSRKARPFMRNTVYDNASTILALIAKG